MEEQQLEQIVSKAWMTVENKVLHKDQTVH